MFRERNLSLILLISAIWLSQLLTHGHAHSNPVIVAILSACAIAEGVSVARAGVYDRQDWKKFRIWHLPYLVAVVVFVGTFVLGCFFPREEWMTSVTIWYVSVFCFASAFVATLVELVMRFLRRRRGCGTEKS